MERELRGQAERQRQQGGGQNDRFHGKSAGV